MAALLLCLHKELQFFVSARSLADTLMLAVDGTMPLSGTSYNAVSELRKEKT